MKGFAFALVAVALSGASALAAPVSVTGQTMIGPDGCLFMKSGKMMVGLNTTDEKLAPGMMVTVTGERFRGAKACMKGHTGVTVASWAPAKAKMMAAKKGSKKMKRG